MHTTSVSLLERLREPCADQAWTRFVDLYTPLIYYWARRMGSTPQETDDLVQEVLTTLVQCQNSPTTRPRAFEAG
jgi:RNA polymerase sigma-70 factor, ECF subfamily